MPRIKSAPLKSKPPRSRMEQVEEDETNESVIDDEEVRNIRAELEQIRRRKAKQIQKLRRIREDKRRQGSPVSSSDSDNANYADCSDQEDPKPHDKSSSSARTLADGLDKSQRRFMFNVKQIEEKYAEKERKALPESLVEIDRDGNFYFPENMAGCHQQSFVNKLFMNDARFGKGLVSAPRNSIESLEGDHRTLKRCRELDEKFGRKLRRSEVSEEESSRKRKRDMSEEASEITLRTESTCTYQSGYMTRTSLDLDDDVFDDRRGPKRRSNGNRHCERLPTTSTIGSFFDSHGSESDDQEFADDEENSEDEEEETTPVANRKTRTIIL